MKSLDRISGAMSRCGSSLASLIKVALLSGRPFKAGQPKTRPAIILGNGPSLRPLLENNLKALGDYDLFAVNFAANAPQFRDIRPQAYVLADPHFFSLPSEDANVERLWDNIMAVEWPMTLYIPVKKRISRELPPNIRVKHFNLTPAEGFRCLVHPLYSAGMAMPRPRNVLIPAIMIAIREGYEKILLAGADHSWSKTLWVDDDNHVVSVQPHFYKDDEKEKKRVTSEYAGYHLHDIFNSFTIAFRAYFDIDAYASRHGVEIFNITPGSFIDAFPRREFPIK